MNTEMTWQTESSKSEDTFAIGEQFGRACRGGEIFLLVSDLGGGKTTFTKGLARGLGSKSVVTSPTFTVSRIYPCRGDLSMHHFDFYRLSEGGMVAHELAEVINDQNVITVIEWGDVVSEVIPAEYIEIQLNRTPAGEDIRDIHATFPNKFKYVFENKT